VGRHLTRVKPKRLSSAQGCFTRSYTGIAAHPSAVITFLHRYRHFCTVKAAKHVHWQPSALGLVLLNEELRSNRDYVMAAVEQNGKALEASAELRGDRDIMLAARQ